MSDILVGWLYRGASSYLVVTRILTGATAFVGRERCTVTPLVRYERDGHVATITYNRPEVLNAINGELRHGLNAAWNASAKTTTAWVGIVTGAGKAFCVGADLARRRGSVGEWPGTFWEIPTINSFESGLELWKPTIAAVNGYCLGYGLTDGGPLRLRHRERPRGVRLPRGPPRRADDRRRDATARSRRLVEHDGDAADRRAVRRAERRTRWVSSGGWSPTTTSWREAQHLADRLVRGAPLAQRATKEMAARGTHLPWEDALRLGESMRRVVGASEDARRDAGRPRTTGTRTLDRSLATPPTSRCAARSSGVDEAVVQEVVVRGEVEEAVAGVVEEDHLAPRRSPCTRAPRRSRPGSRGRSRAPGSCPRCSRTCIAASNVLPCGYAIASMRPLFTRVEMIGESPW